VVFEKEKRQQMINEMRTLVDSPQQPGLVSFFGAFYSPETNQINIALEYVEGGSLAGWSPRRFALIVVTKQRCRETTIPARCAPWKPFPSLPDRDVAILVGCHTPLTYHPHRLMTPRTDHPRPCPLESVLRTAGAVPVPVLGKIMSGVLEGRGLHSSTFRVNVSAFCAGIGGALRGCSGGV